MIAGAVVLVVAAIATGGFMWRAHSEEQAQQVAKVMADKLRMEEQAQEAEMARVREEELRQQSETNTEGQGAGEDGELEDDTSEIENPEGINEITSPNNSADKAPPSAQWTAQTAHLLLTDAVPKEELDRRAQITHRLTNEDAAAQARIATLQAPRLLMAAGIDAATVMPSQSLIQQTVLLSNDDATALESALEKIDSLPKPTRGDRKSARAANDEGLRFMENEQYADAVITFNRALTSDPADVEVLGNLAYAYLKNGQLSEMLKVSSYVVRIAPRRADTWNQIAVAHAMRGADWQAVRAYSTLYKLSKNQTKTREFLTRTATEHHDVLVRDAAKTALLVLPEPIETIAR